MRRAWEALQAGTASVSLRDLAALVRLAHEIEREHERDHHAGHPDERWRLALTEVLWEVRRHLREKWPEFAASLRSNETLLDLWPPGPGP